MLQKERRQMKKFNKENVIFLLGGHDLEMVTIRDILDAENIAYMDESQKWGAKLSDYSRKLEAFKEKQFYAVELIIDDKTLLEKYDIEIIDHHNEYTGKDASLLQVLQLLGIEVTRNYELIAANDVNHKAGMQCISATKDEIDYIRKQDRKAQGITKEQENIAIQEIKKVYQEGSVFIIESVLDNFTPIVDFYDKRPLIVYSNRALMFYGDISHLKEKYKDEIKNNEAFQGLNYFGFDTKYVETKGSTLLVAEVVKLVDTMSYHSFMFPFSFDKKPGKEETLSSHIEIDDAFVKALTEEGWKYSQLTLESCHDVRVYNEFSYYAKPVRDMLYNKDENFKKGETSYYFTKEVEDGEYTITLIDGTKYNLQLTNVYLRLFETGIGILVFETENHTYSNFEDILKINEYGRRVYPQYLDSHYENYADGTKRSFLADSIEVKLKKDSKSVVEKFHDEYQQSIPNKLLISKHIIEVLGKDVFSQEDENESLEKENKSFCQIKPILDDRMFVVSYAEDAQIINCLQSDDENYKHNDDWYRYLFVDGNSKTVQYAPMQAKLAEKSTYLRWLGWGTLWGITRYSFVALTTAGGREMILPHTQYHYHQMAIIILAIQASLARFRDEISILSNLKDNDDLENKVQIMYEYYIKFINKLHFRELTSQDQGIELYAIAKKVMNFDKEIKDLDNEIAELHTYVQMKTEKNRNDRLETISKLGAVFLPPSFLAGIYGMNVFNFTKTQDTLDIALIAMFLSALIGYFSVSSFKNWKLKWKGIKNNKFNFIVKVFFVVMMLLVIFGSLRLIGEAKPAPIEPVYEIKGDSEFMNKLELSIDKVGIKTQLREDKNENNQSK